MIKDFINLKEEEQKILVEAPVYITILVAGADHEIDKKELEWASKLPSFRSQDDKSVLHDYYIEVEKIFNNKIYNFLSELPTDYFERNKIVSNELRKINDIMPKLSNDFANSLYKSFKSFADQVARASGGILGLSSISPEEKEMMKLDMIDPPKA